LHLKKIVHELPKVWQQLLGQPKVGLPLIIRVSNIKALLHADTLAHFLITHTRISAVVWSVWRPSSNLLLGLGEGKEALALHMMEHQLMSAVLRFPRNVDRWTWSYKDIVRGIADPSKTLVDFALIKAMVAEIDEADGA